MPSSPVTQQSAAQHAVRGRFGGLDGLRAIAVGMVLAYHLFPRALPGGFLGVDIFFVISGFLITSLLVREHRSTGTIRLGSFWRRRARRLLPALALVVLVSASLSLLASRDLLVGIAKQIAGAVFFVSNWVFIADGADYFARDTPELFRNFWSLALEEQFYIVLPLISLALVALRSRALSTLVLAGLGVASATLMAVWALGGADPTRVYFGSDSHSFGLLLGAALAVLAARDVPKPVGRAGNIASTTLTVVGLGVLAYLGFTLPEGSLESFAGGFQIATLAALGVVWAITREGAWVGRALDVQPLKWIGERSYGIYLWHWPLLLIFSSIARSAGIPWITVWGVPLATAVATALFAALSYEFVEQPVRRLGLRGAFQRWFTPRAYTRKQRRVSIVLAAVLAVGFPLTGVAVAVAPDRGSSAETILRGQHHLELAGGGAKARPTLPHPGQFYPSSPPGAPPPPPLPFTVEGRDITAIGDSVMLASYPELAAALPGIDVDAGVSRSFSAGVDLLAQMAEAGTIRRVIVFGLGTNGPIDPTDFERLRGVVGDRLLVLINAYGDRYWMPGVNEAISQFADAERGVVVARWNEAITPKPEFLAGDGIHPHPAGGGLYAASVVDALLRLEDVHELRGWGTLAR